MFETEAPLFLQATAQKVDEFEVAFGCVVLVHSTECGMLQQVRGVRQVEQSTSHASTHSRSRAEKKSSQGQVGKDTF